MAYQPNAEKIARAYAGEELLDEGKPVRFSVVELGPLVVASGAVAASDPLVSPSPEPFRRAVPNGRHPVRLAVAAFENGDERVAFAEVRFAGAPVARWEPAVQPKEGEPLADGEYLGYGVDAGTGCFMDPAAGRALEDRMNEDDRYYETILEELERTSRPTWSWATIRPAPEREENVVCFSSGWGDGVYPSFLGFAADGTLAAILTDFLVLVDDLPKDSTDVGPVRAPGLPSPESPAPAPPAPESKRPWWKLWGRAS